MDDQLKGQVALVTGASSGFGIGIARQLKNNGAKVYILARRREILGNIASQIGAVPVVADITNPEDWDRVFELLLKEEGRVDILINNAGAGGNIKPIEEQDDQSVFETININFTGAILGSKRAARIMKHQGSGTIINISSICSFQAWAGWSIYGAAKAGLEQFTRHLYVEMRPFGVRATILTPSWGATDFARNANLPPTSSEIQKKSIQPDEIGDIVVKVCQLPDHLIIPEIKLLPMVQQIDPY